MKTFVLILLIIAVNSYSQTWQQVNEIGDGTYVHSIFYPKSDPNKVVVLADSIPIDKSLKLIFPSYFALLTGYGYFESNDGGNTFPQQRIVDSRIFLSMTQAINDPNKWIASTIDKNISSIGYSTDKGQTWDFETSDCDLSSKILNFIDVDSKMLAGAVSTGFGLVEGGNDFEMCDNNDTVNVSARDFKRHKNRLFMASDDNAKTGVYFSSNLGDSWSKDQSGLSGVRVNTVCPSPEYEFYKVVLCGGDRYQVDKYVGAGIFYSSDNGQTWKQQGAANAKVYDIEYHPKDPLFMLAACGESGLYISSNGGITWVQNNEGLPEGADVRYVSFPDKEKSNNGYEVYIGIFEKGLWKISNFNPTLTTVETNKEINVSIAPNPFENEFDIYYNSEINENVDFEIYSLEGEKVFSINKFVNIGENYINVSNINLSSGIYLLKINSQNGIKTIKLIRK